MCVLQAADEPAYLTVGTDVSAKYRGAFCEAKIKTVKRLVKVKVRLQAQLRTGRPASAADGTPGLGCGRSPPHVVSFESVPTLSSQ